MSDIAIVGLDCAYGACEDLEAFARAIYGGWSPEVSGASPCLDVAEVVTRSVRRYGLQQAFSVPAAGTPRLGAVVYGGAQTASAVSDALAPAIHGSDPRSEPRAARGSLLLQSVPVASPGNDLAQALRVAMDWLESEAADLVLVAGRDPLGIGVVLLTRVTSLVTGRVYATISSVVSGAEEDLARVCAEGLRRAGITPADVGYLESTYWPRRGIADAYTLAGSPGDLTCAVGTLGLPDGAVSSMGALIKAVLCLDRRMLPQTLAVMDATGDPSSGAAEGERDTPFYLVPETRPWFVEPTRESHGQEQRRLAAVVFGEGGRVAQAILSEPGPYRDAPSVRPQLTETRHHLFPIAASSKSELLARLNDLRRRIAGAPHGARGPHGVGGPHGFCGPHGLSGHDLSAVSKRAFEAYEAETDAPYALAIVGCNRDEILRDIDFALDDGVERAFAMGTDWQTPRGSAFTASPVGPAGVAFVYPGAFNSYMGMGRDLFQHFPGLHEGLAALVSDLGRATASRYLYPRSRSRLSDADLKRRMRAFAEDPPALIESGTIFAVAYTMILQELFGVQPAAALGYSLGETSMLWAAGVWRDGDRGGAALRGSRLFKTRIAGPKEAIREHWGLDAGEDVSWATFLLKAGVAEVQKAVAREPRVYLTLINQEDEVVIAGEEAGCRRLIETLECHSLPIPYEVVIHNAAMRSAYGDFVDLYSYPVVDRPDVTFYSAASYGPLELEREALAHAMAKMTCQSVDFPRLVEQVYQDGARIFVELGPLGTCTRRIARILQPKPHAAVAVNPGPDQGFEGILRALAQLLTHRVPVELSRLYGAEEASALAIRVRSPQAERGSVAAHGEAGRAQRVPTWRLRETGGASWSGEAVGSDQPPPRPVVDADVQGAGSAPQAPDSRVASRNAGAPSSASSGWRSQHNLSEQALSPLGRGAIRAHQQLLEARAEAQLGARSLIQLQLTAGRRLLDDVGPSSDRDAPVSTVERRVTEGPHRDTPMAFTAPVTSTGPVMSTGTAPVPLFDENDLQEFAQGDAVQCFGPDFAVYRGRRLPRIPNSDLLLMDRVVDVDGEPGALAEPAALRSEFDVSHTSWFYQGGQHRGLPPYVILMEMALQPCGFLSAYLRSSLLDPQGDLYFRNLDGRARVLADTDLRGKTVTDEVRLVSSTRGQGTILQSYTFALSCEGERFYEGWASFGYFPKQALARQVGLDEKGRQSPGSALSPSMEAISPALEPAPHRLRLLDEVSALPGAGEYGHGYLRASGRLNPRDWFFRAHFYEDPVMPGSLGVEAAMQAMRAYARRQHPEFVGARAVHLVDHEMTWKYRGQITPDDRRWRLGVDVAKVEEDPLGLTLIGDADVWKGDLRIYEVKDIAVRLSCP